MPSHVNRLEAERRTSPTGQTVWIAWVCVGSHQFRSSRTWDEAHPTRAKAVAEVRRRVREWANTILSQIDRARAKTITPPINPNCPPGGVPY